MGKSKSGCSNLTKILRFLGRFKNGWWIHKIHTLDGFFGSHSQNPDFWDYRFKGSIFVGAMGGEGFEKSIYDKRFTVHVWHLFINKWLPPGPTVGHLHLFQKKKKKKKGKYPGDGYFGIDWAIMYKFSFVEINLPGYWPREWKCSYIDRLALDNFG